MNNEYLSVHYLKPSLNFTSVWFLRDGYAFSFSIWCASILSYCDVLLIQYISGVTILSFYSIRFCLESQELQENIVIFILEKIIIPDLKLISYQLDLMYIFWVRIWYSNYKERNNCMQFCDFQKESLTEMALYHSHD